MESRRPGGKRRRFNIFFLVLVVIFLYFSGILVNQQIHLYTMNNPQVAKQISDSVASIRRV